MGEKPKSKNEEVSFRLEIADAMDNCEGICERKAFLDGAEWIIKYLKKEKLTI